jgi:tocopherol O-methyltransferase
MIDARAHAERVTRYYTATEWDYRRLWAGRTEQALHIGYWDETVATHRESLARLNAVIAQQARITAQDRVLDAGSGWGGTSIWLAQNVGCNVVGISIIPAQVERASATARSLGLEGEVRFIRGDYADTGFDDHSFDVVLACESFVHATDREAAIREAARLLRPGGRLVISEYVLRSDPALTSSERRRLRPWLDGWAMPDLVAEADYERLLERSGFRLVQATDISPNILPSVTRLYNLTLRGLGLPLAKLFQVTGVFPDERYLNVKAVITMYRCRDLWRYAVIVAGVA